MLLKTPEVAKKLRVTKATLESWRCRGGGPQFVKYGRAVRYRPEDIEIFLEKSLRSSTSQCCGACKE
jgi:predicted DNA-binding transcriptional regulator AlpA